MENLFERLAEMLRPDLELEKAFNHLEKQKNDFLKSIEVICQDYETKHPERKKIAICECPDCEGTGCMNDCQVWQECELCFGWGKIKI